MIYKNDDGTNVFEFGTGDIEISDGWLEEDKDIPCVAFIQQKLGKIGERARSIEKYGNEPVLRSDANTLFIFNDPRSIDVLIGRLQHAKEHFLKSKEEK